MPRHYWEDQYDDFDWKALYQAQSRIVKLLQRFNINLYVKEKYGTLRCSQYVTLTKEQSDLMAKILHHVISDSKYDHIRQELIIDLNWDYIMTKFSK